MERRGSRLDLRLTRAERERWEAAAKERGVPLSFLVRRAVEADLMLGTQQGANGGLYKGIGGASANADSGGNG